jgi:hypothetical protein
VNKIFFVILSVALTACASKPEETAKVSGTRISKSEVQKLQLTKAGTIGELLRSQMGKYPQLEEGKTCKELLTELKENGFKIKSVKEKEIIAITSDNKSLKYTLNDGGCV